MRVGFSPFFKDHMPVMPRPKGAKKISDKLMKSPFPRQKKSSDQDQGEFGRDMHDMASTTMKKHPPVDI